MKGIKSIAQTKDIVVLERKSTNTAFILMFPALILAGLAVVSLTSFWLKVLACALAVYQFLMLKKFIEDYYKKG